MQVTTKPYKKFPTMHAVFVNDVRVMTFRDKGDDIYIMPEQPYFHPAKSPARYIPKNALVNMIKNEVLPGQMEKLEGGEQLATV